MKTENMPTVYSAVKVPATFNVSVTGHRSLSYSDQFDPCIDTVANILVQLGKICRKYDPVVELRLNTALAVGADQIAALAMHKANETMNSPGVLWALQTILPFERHSYEHALELGLRPEDNALVRNKFSELLDSANRIYELADRECISGADVGNATQYWQNTRYRTLGHILSRQADIVLALWNGDDGGKGGTADVVAMALKQGKPVIRLDPASMTLSWLMPYLGATDPIDLACKQTPVPANQIGELLVGEYGIEALVKQVLELPSEEAASDLPATNSKNTSGSSGSTTGKHSNKEKPTPVFSTVQAFLGSNTFSLDPSIETRQGNQLFTFRKPGLNWLLRFNWLRSLFAANSFPGKTKATTRAFVYQKFADLITKDKHTSTTKKLANDDVNNNEPDSTKTPFSDRFRLKTDYALDSWIQSPVNSDNTPIKQARPLHISQIDEQLKPTMISTDAIATARGHMYRSSYVVTFLGGTLAVWIGLTGIFAKDTKHWFVFIELLLLLGLVAFYFIAHIRSWHSRWLNARHITESLRAGRFLIWLGLGGRRAVPRDDTPWSAWYFNAVMATAPVPHHKLQNKDIHYIAGELRSHIQDQINYHEKNSEKLLSMHHQLDLLGRVCLGITIFTATVYVAGSLSVYSEAFQSIKYLVTLICAGLPALAGALMGIRFQGDFERFANRSDQTRKQLEQIDSRLESVAMHEPATYEQPLFEELILIVEDLSAVFEKDIEDWHFVYGARPTPEAA